MKKYIAFHIVCGVLAYGITFAHYQRSYPKYAREQYRSDMALSVFFGLTGPVGLMAGYLSSGFAEHGLKFK